MSSPRTPENSSSFRELSAQELMVIIQKDLRELQELAPNTKNKLVTKLTAFESELLENKVQNYEELYPVLEQSQQLIQKLKLAQEAVQYVQERLQNTNEPYNPFLNQKLETLRQEKNVNDVVSTAQKFKTRREKQGNPEFEQTAYRKYVGMNMRFWALHAASKKEKEEKKLGNCTEQSNAAFAYVYQHTYNKLADKENPFVNRLERMDVNNNQGGHCYIMVDRDKTKGFSRGDNCSINAFLKEIDNFGNTGVVIDPWNKKNPFYPISDLPEKMHPLGLKGSINIEFGLDFSNQQELNSFNQKNSAMLNQSDTPQPPNKKP